MPSITKIMAFEQGRMTQSEIIAFIQDGINKGWIWELQRFYGRIAEVLIDHGFCTTKGQV